MRILHDIARDLTFVCFLALSVVVVSLFTVRLALALFSSDQVEACYLKNRSEGYVLVFQRRWQVIPQEAHFPTLNEALASAKILCDQQGRRP